ncbi:MAG: hypothetical protein ABH872_02570 [Candidatus Omnitrophota bacterium]
MNNDIEITDNIETETISHKNIKLPLGVLILGRFNFFIFGLASFLLSLFMLFKPASRFSQSLLDKLSAYLPEEALTFTYFKLAVVLQAAIALLFIMSGLGLLKRREWARKLTLYFSFASITIIVISGFRNTAIIGQGIFQIIYPAILIFYFTNKNIENYFNLPYSGNAENNLE